MRDLVFVADGGKEPEQRWLQRRHITADDDGHRLAHRSEAGGELCERPRPG